MKEVLTTCPYCGTGCNLNLIVEAGRVINTRPCKDHPISRGILCPKGATVHMFVHHPDRLTVPLIREKGDFREASWEEAYDRIAREFNNIRERYGNEALAVIASARGTNEENFIAQKFARVVLGTHNVENCCRICHSASAMALQGSLGTGAATNSIKDILKTKVILLTGADPSVSHPIIWHNFIRKAVKSGTKLIVIDPRKTLVARAAGMHLQIKPGTDIALFNAMMHHIIKKNLIDLDFISSRTEGFEALKKIVENYPPERSEKITGIPADLIRQAAELYASCKPAMALHGIGVTEHSSGLNNVRAIINLALITGNVGKEGSGVNPLRGQNNVQGAADMGAVIECLPGYHSAFDDEHRAKFSKAWGRELPSINSDPQKGPHWLSQIWNRIIEGQLKGMYNIGTNIVLTEGNVQKVKEALKSLDFLVVQDIFLTDTAKYADVVLPAATFAEKDGTFTNADRRIQRIRKAIEPVGQSKPDWQILCELSERMGYLMRYESASDIMAEIASVIPSYAGINYDRLDNNHGMQWPATTSDHLGTEILHINKFAIGTGKIQPGEHIPPAEEPDKNYPLLLTTGRTSMQYNSGTMTRRSPKLERSQPENWIELSQEDAKKYHVGHDEIARVVTRRGSLEVKVKIAEILEGVIWMPFHYSESATNILTNDAIDPNCGITELKACAAKIEPVGSGSA